MELNRALAAEVSGIKLRRLLDALRADEISQEDIDSEVEAGKKFMKSDSRTRTIVDTNLWISKE